MKNVILILFFCYSTLASAKELRVKVRSLPLNSILIAANRQIIPSVFYRIEKDAIIFSGNSGDIGLMKQMVEQKTLMPFFQDAFQELRAVSYPITFQISDPLYLISISQTLSCRSVSFRQSHCSSLGYYTSPGCRLSQDVRSKLERALKVTTSLDGAKSLKVVSDNPCLNPKTESLYEFALKDISHRMAVGDLQGVIEITYEAYQIAEQPLEIL